MWNLLWPVLVVVGSNCLYNICTKSTPQEVNAFASLTVTYLISAVIAFVLFLLSNRERHAAAAFAKLNWTSYALGFSVVALEFGYICLYRAGWKVNTGSLVANICLAIALVFIGFILYREGISMRKVAGMLVCIAGLILISK